MKKMRKNEGFTLIELLIVVAIIGIIAAIAVPGLLRARASGNEASAIGSMRSIHSGNLSYFSSCGGYSITFQGAAGLADPANRFLPGEFNALQPIQKSGYNITLGDGLPAGPGGSNVGMCAGGRVTFFAMGRPIVFGTSGQRTFAIRELGTIFVDTTNAAIVDADPQPVVGGNVTTLQ